MLLKNFNTFYISSFKFKRTQHTVFELISNKFEGNIGSSNLFLESSKILKINWNSIKIYQNLLKNMHVKFFRWLEIATTTYHFHFNYYNEWDFVIFFKILMGPMKESNLWMMIKFKSFFGLALVISMHPKILLFLCQLAIIFIMVQVFKLDYTKSGIWYPYQI